MNLKIIGLSFMSLAAACALPAAKKNAAAQMADNSTAAGKFEPVAVIELFTSQGCSSCPPADRLLSKTIAAAKGKKIFALSFHVDYWNRLGWKDPFSSAAFSQRQGEYAAALHTNGAYTPQMVVNGAAEFVGSDAPALNKALAGALAAKAAVSFTALKMDNAAGSPLKISYALDGAYAGKEIHFALVSLKETTVIKRGENGGSTLTNENVVRQFITENAQAAGSISFAAEPAMVPGNFAVIAFVQEKGSGMIAGAAEAE